LAGRVGAHFVRGRRAGGGPDRGRQDLHPVFHHQAQRHRAGAGHGAQNHHRPPGQRAAGGFGGGAHGVRTALAGAPGEAKRLRREAGGRTGMDTILIVEDKHELRLMLKTALTHEGFGVAEASNGEAAVKQMHGQQFALVLTDLKLPGMNGLEVLQAAHEHAPGTPVVIMTAYGSIEEAVRAVKDGAYDFIQKPLDLGHLTLLLRRAIAQQQLLRQNVLLKEEFAAKYGFPKIIGEHESMQRAAAALQRIAPTDTTALLLGESGTGKELFARALHRLSPRANEAFVAINCAAIPETLVETELFGHEKGAFTGANARKLGKFELAHRGTIFLDEIGEIPLAVQAKILRVLEERAFERLGG